MKRALFRQSFRVCLIAAVAFCALSCEADGSEDPDDPPDEANIGVVMPNNGGRWGSVDGPGLAALFKEADAECTVLYSADSVATEASNVRTVIREGCDVLLITVVDREDSEAAIASAADAGLTVILYDRPVLGNTRAHGYVSIDNVEIGRRQAETLVAAAGSGSALPLYLYSGAPWDFNSWYFLAGSWEILQPKIADGTFAVRNSEKAVEYGALSALSDFQLEEIIDETTTGWNQSTTESLVANNLADPGFEAGAHAYVLAPNDLTARVIGDAFRAEGASLTVTGQDGDVASLQYLLDGKQDMSVVKRVQTVIATATDLCVTIAEGESPSFPESFNNGTKDISFKSAPMYPVYDEADIRALVDEGWYQEADFDWPSE